MTPEEYKAYIYGQDIGLLNGLVAGAVLTCVVFIIVLWWPT